MLINDLITPLEAEMASLTPRLVGVTPNEMDKSFKFEESARIVYAPLLLTIAAFVYAQTVLECCPKLHLPYKKECREVREAIADYKYQTVEVFRSKICKMLNEKMSDLYEAADEGMDGIWEAVKKGLRKKHPDLTSLEMDLLCSASVCSCLLLYVKQLEENNGKVMEYRLKRPMRQTISAEGAKVLNFVGKVIEGYKVDDISEMKAAMAIIANKVNEVSAVSEDEIERDDQDMDAEKRYMELVLQKQGCLPGDYRRASSKVR